MDILLTLALMAISLPVFSLIWHGLLRTVLIRLDERIESDVPPIPAKIRYLGGPFDGRIELVHESQRKPFFIAPYIPKNPDERGEQYGEVHGMPLFKPNLAYYREMTPEDYFYVRDITHEEYGALLETGLPPAIQNEDMTP